MFKKNFFQLVLAPSIFICAATVCHEQFSKTALPKKKILIFTSPGGGGHMSATRALQEYLGDEYEISSSFIFQEVLGSFDPISTITFGYSCGEATYNYFITKKFYRILNAMGSFGTWYHSSWHNSITKKIVHFLDNKKPDMVISVVPYVNNALLEATQSLDIPFIMLPTDLDVRTFIGGIKKPDYKKFHLILGLHDDEILERVNKAEIPADQITIGGFPLRSDFLSKKNNIRALKKEFNVPQDKPVLMIMMGAAGSNSIYKFIKQLSVVQEPLHLIVVLGRNEQIRGRIESIPLPASLSMTILGFTNRVADLMSISDLCLTKSGSVSFCEALYSGLPLVIDATTHSIRWERFNHHFTEKYFVGYVVKRYDALPQLLSQLLQNPQIIDRMKQNLHTIEKPKLNKNIRPIIQRLLA
jgi:processive 1,2-diacylglycerol beta-glucosyltransferase